MTLTTDAPLARIPEPRKVLKSDLQVKFLKAEPKAYKVTAGNGLRIVVQPNGSKLWRWKYYFEGREKQMAFGSYPEVKLSEARDRRDDARRILRMGFDPILQPVGATAIEIAAAKVVAGARSFEEVAREWYGKNEAGWAASYKPSLLRWLEMKIYPVLGRLPLTAIGTTEVIGLVRSFENKGIPQTGRRVCTTIEAVFDYARALGYCDHNPATGLAKAKVFQRVVTVPQPALTTLPEIVALLRATERVETKVMFKLALRFLALTAARTQVVREATWNEIEGLDGNQPVWRVAGKRMKMRDDWVSPLSSPAVDILRAMEPLRRGRQPDYIFPHWSQAKAGKPISESSMTDVIRAAGFGELHVPHGFRSSFSTIMNDRANVAPGDENAIEAQLAHKLPGVKGIYNRGAYLQRRADLCAEWAAMIVPADAPTARELVMTS